MILPERVLGGSSAQMIRLGELADPLRDRLANAGFDLSVAVAATTKRDASGTPRAHRGRLDVAVQAVVRDVGMVLPVGIAFWAQGIDIGALVGWAFVIAASTFCPMLLLGIWWTRLTARGAAWGMTTGAAVATAGIFLDLALGEPSGVYGALLAQPAVVSVPVAFAIMIGVSLRTPEPADMEVDMLALHAPEGLGLAQREHAVPGRLEIALARG
jgi:cation/acetate symporter